LLSFGPKFSIDLCDKFSVYTLVNFSFGSSVYYNEKNQGVERGGSFQYTTNYDYTNDGTEFSPQLNLSMGGGLIYKLNDRINLGLSNEVYFYKNDFIRKHG